MIPREYSSYPSSSQDLRSFCALPLKRADHVVAVLLCAFRIVDPSHAKTFRALIADELRGVFCGLEVVSEGFMGLGETGDRSETTLVDISGDTSFAGVRDTDETGAPKLLRGDLARAIGAQEEERRRISRELHDGVAQELLTVTFTLQRLTDHVDAEGADILEEARGGINGVLDELHNISVMRAGSAIIWGSCPLCAARPCCWENLAPPSAQAEALLPASIAHWKRKPIACARKP